LRKDDNLLDLGCGYGRLAYGLREGANFDGHYLGMDILERHIVWCSEHLQSVDNRYEFKHLDILNARYNPLGSVSAESWQIGIEQQFDFVSLFSVFTHMYEEEIRNYLQQIHTALVKGGRCFSTFFLYDEQRLEKITNPDNVLCMGFELNDHTRFHNADDKLHAICFEKSYIESMILDAGFTILKTNYGQWAGGDQSYQDFVLMEK